VLLRLLHVAQPAVVYEVCVAHDPSWDADEALTAVYTAHYASLVRLGALLLRDTGAAEEIVQDAFVAMHGHWNRLRDPHKALAYLRTAVVNRCRSRQRHLMVVDKHLPRSLPDAPSAEQLALRTAETDRVIEAMRGLPDKQRTVMVLRYYGELSEAEIAETMGISKGSVKSHAARATKSLRQVLERSV
jgi:RNA polymerase sigma-70 factor (sigma-E family)